MKHPNLVGLNVFSSKNQFYYASHISIDLHFEEICGVVDSDFHSGIVFGRCASTAQGAHTPQWSEQGNKPYKLIQVDLTSTPQSPHTANNYNYSLNIAVQLNLCKR